jgi:hypothetical protein
MEDVKAAAEQLDAQRQQKGRAKAPQRLGDKRELALALDRPPIAIDVDAVQFLARRVVATPFRTDKADRVAVLGQRCRMQPGTPIERHGQTLQYIEHAALGGIHRGGAWLSNCVRYCPAGG